MKTLQTGLLPIIRRVRRPLMPPEPTPEPQPEKKAEPESPAQEQSDDCGESVSSEAEQKDERS